jgi:hypothetical protein
MLQKQLAVILLLLSNLALAETPSKELYMPNESGGFITLTTDVCPSADAAKLDYNYRAYATESDSEKPATHEGCWTSPSVADAPKMEGVRIIPLVNLWFDGDLITFPQTLFGPEKKHWDIKLPEITVKPNV